MELKEPLLKHWITRFELIKKGNIFNSFIDFNLLFQFLQEIIEKIETNSDTVNRVFLSAFIPKLEELLKSFLAPKLINSASGMRDLILKAFHSICAHSLVPEELKRVHCLLLEVAKLDTEDNALVALRIVKESLHKNFRSMEPMMDCIEKFLWQEFENFKEKFHRVFSLDKKHISDSLPMDLEHCKGWEKILSKDSFKVMSEIQAITLITMGVHAKGLRSKMFDLIPHIVDDLALMPSKEAQECNKNKFLEFLNAQNSLYLIITNLLRILANNEVMQKQAQRLANYSIMFLKNCPPEYGHIRKPFLLMLKNMVISYIDMYLEHFDDLLNYDLLVGESNGWPDLKAEASSIILNVAQCTKEKLNEEQKWKMIRIILTTVNDNGISTSLQATAILTLNKYIDIISKMPQSTRILMEIVEFLRMKFEFLFRRLPTLFIEKIKESELINKQSKYDGLCKIIGKTSLTESEPQKDADVSFYIETGKCVISRDTDDILKETKQMIQKMIALMQSVINTLCSSSDLQKDTNIPQLARLFRNVIKYFVVKMAIHKIYGKNLAVETEDMEKNVKLFVETYIRMDLASFAQIMDKEMEFLCKCITTPVAEEPFKDLNITDMKMFNNDFLLKIPQYMRDELTKVKDKAQREMIQMHVGVFAYCLGIHLLKAFNEIGGYKQIDPTELNILKYSHYLSLFGYTIEIFGKLEENDGIYSFYFTFIVLCMRYSRKAKLFYNYFAALRLVNMAIKERIKDAAQRRNSIQEYSTLFPGLIPILLRIHQEFSNNEIITEILQCLPTSMQSLMEYLPQLIRPLMDSISPTRCGGSLGTNSVKCLESWLEKISRIPEFSVSLQATLTEFIPSLHKLFCCQHLICSTHSIFSNLGGNSRSPTIEKEVYTKFYPDDGLRLVITERTTRKNLILGMDSCLDSAFRYLESTTRVKPENIKFIYKLVESAYYSFMDNSFDRSYIAQCYSALANRNYDELRRIAEKTAADEFNSEKLQTRVSLLKRDCQKHTFEKLLTEIFYITAAYYWRDIYTNKLRNFFNFVCDHLVLIGLCRNGQLGYGRVSEIDPITYLNVITEFLDNSKDFINSNIKDNQITNVAISAVKRVAETYTKIFTATKDTLLNVQLLELLIRRICAHFYWKEWAKKEGASLAILELLNILPATFFIKHEQEIVLSLLYGFSTLPEFLTVTAHQTCPKCIYKLLSVCHSEPHFTITGENIIEPTKSLSEYIRRVAKVKQINARIIEIEYIANFRKIIEKIISGLHTERKNVRKLAKNCIEQISRLEMLTLEQLLNIKSFAYVNKGKVLYSN